MDEIKLKSCPFCGAAGEVRQAGNLWFVTCTNDTISCPVRPWTGAFIDKYKAIKVWNRRAEHE